MLVVVEAAVATGVAAVVPGALELIADLLLLEAHSTQSLLVQVEQVGELALTGLMVAIAYLVQ